MYGHGRLVGLVLCAFALAGGCVDPVGGFVAPEPLKADPKLVNELREFVWTIGEEDEDGQLKLRLWCKKKGLDRKATVAALCDLLHDKEVYRRSFVTQALGEIGDERAVPVLIEKLLDDAEHPWLRWEFARALGKIGNKRAVQPLLKTVASEQWQLRHSSVCALGWIGDEGTFDVIAGRLGDGNAAVRKEACEALQDFGSKRGIDFLRKLLEKEEDVKVIAAAKKAIEVLVTK